VGFAAFVLLTPLAATSFNRAMKAMGAKRWQLLHKLVYVIAGLGILHFFWMRAGKNNFAEVAVYAAILACCSDGGCGAKKRRKRRVGWREPPTARAASIGLRSPPFSSALHLVRRVSRSRIRCAFAVDQHLRRPAARVVVAGHAHAIRAGRQHRQQVARLHRQLAVAADPVAALAHRADHVVGRAGSARCVHRHDPWKASYMAGRGRSFIAASTMQKFFCSPGLRYSTSVMQTPALPTSERPGSIISFAVAVAARIQLAQQALPERVGGRRLLAVVVDAQAAAEVDVRSGMPAASIASPGPARGPSHRGRADSR
jgi:hypothetical protein